MPLHMAQNIGQIVADAWLQTLDETPDPFRDDLLYRHLSGLPRMTHRDWLTRPRYNHRGELIPRITLVRRNIMLLGKPKHPPRIP